MIDGGGGAASVFMESICVSPKGSEGNTADDTNKVTAISIMSASLRKSSIFFN